MGFQNQPVGGTTLVRAAIKSPNFVTGSTGWTINKNGSAEFNNLTIRSGTIISGVFLLYSSAIPAKGNLVAAFAPVTGGTDSVGNVYPQGFTFGTWNASGAFTSGTHIDTSGNISLTDSTGAVRLYEAPANGAAVFYDPSGQALGHQLVSAVANAFTDPAGNTIQRGLTAYSLSNPNTAYAQLIGAALQFFDTTNAATAPGQIGLASSGITGTNDSLDLLSPLSAGSDIQSSLLLIRAPTPGPALVQINNAAFNVKTNATPGQPASGLYLYSDSNGYPRAKASVSGDTNAYGLARQSKHLTADQTINSTTPAVVGANSTPLSFAMAANVSYRFHAVIIWTQGAVQAQQAFRVTATNGLALGNMRIQVSQWQQSTGGQSIFADVFSALNTDNAVVGASGFAATAGVTTELDGVVTPSVGGTFNLVARCVTSSADTYTIRSWSFAEIMPE